MLTLLEALDRVLANEAQGNAAECELVADVEGLTTGTKLAIATLRRQLRSDGEAAQQIYRVDRSMKNWSILRDETPVVRAHPWDDSPNVAYLVGSTMGMGSAIGRTLIDDVEALANRMERHKLMGEALVLWRVHLSLCTRLGDARLATARSECVRLTQLIQTAPAAPEAAPA